MGVNAFLVLRTGTKKSPSTHKLFIGCELPVERLTIRQHLAIITGKKAGEAQKEGNIENKTKLYSSLEQRSDDSTKES